MKRPLELFPDDQDPDIKLTEADSNRLMRSARPRRDGPRWLYWCSDSPGPIAAATRLRLREAQPALPKGIKVKPVVDTTKAGPRDAREHFGMPETADVIWEDDPRDGLRTWAVWSGEGAPTEPPFWQPKLSAWRRFVGWLRARTG